MRKDLLGVVALALVPACAFAVDGQVLINQATVMTAGGFPYHITLPGSYKLSGNLTASPGADAISIDSDNVTLDLNGFTIRRQTPPAGTGISSGKENVTVRNGVITGFLDGIHLSGSGLAADLQVFNNLFTGMTVSGYLVAHCSANQNFTGIVASNSTISDSHASGGDMGMSVQDSIVVNSTANGNGIGFGGTNSTLIQNVANNNGWCGIMGDRALFGSNTLLNNGTDTCGPVGMLFSQGNNLCSTGLC